MRRGEIWLMEPPREKPRPVLVVTRDGAIPVLNSVVVAPITTTLRSNPTCLSVGVAEGLHQESVATFDDLRTVSKSALTHRIGALMERDRICEALLNMADC